MVGIRNQSVIQFMNSWLGQPVIHIVPQYCVALTQGLSYVGHT
jgi:hypothetical protein